MTSKKRKSSGNNKPWCWYCDREFEDEKVLITHQKAKHFKCPRCHKKLNSPSGLVIHVAQIHKENLEIVPNAIEGHDTPEVEIFGMQGIPTDDLQRHREGLPSVPYKKMKLAQGGLLPLLAAQKGTVPDGPDFMTSFPPLGTTLSHFAPPSFGASPLLPVNTTLTLSPPLSLAVTSSTSPSLGSPSVGPTVDVPVSTNANDSSYGGRADEQAPLSLRIPSSVDPNGKVLPAGIIYAPDLHISMVRPRLQID